MHTAEFLKLITPTQGLKCIAKQSGKGFQHGFSDDVDQAAQTALLLDAKGFTVYYAMASFKTVEGGRKGANVHSVKSLWLDLDCGEGKPYTSQDEGLEALDSFVASTNLPAPLVVGSGYGLHVYWPLSEDLTPEEWWSYALRLKSAADLCGLRYDPACFDIARVLRPVGTHNRKRGTERPVAVLEGRAAPGPGNQGYSRSALERSLPSGSGATRTPGGAANSDLRGEYSGPQLPAYAGRAAEQCAQIRLFRDAPGDLDEPTWYAGIGVLRFCVDGEQRIHEWSAGHPGYSREETDWKILHSTESTSGPTTCAKFESVNPSGCVECPLRGRIKTPLQSAREPEGFTVPASAEHHGVDSAHSAGGELPPADVLPELPRGYRRGTGGIWYVDTGDDGEGQQWRLLSHLDFYVISRTIGDEEAFAIRVLKPREGWEEFSVETSALGGSLTDLGTTLAARGLVIKPGVMKVVRGYLIDWFDKLQQEADAIYMVKQMGWQKDHSFVHANQRYLPSGEVYDATLHETIAKSCAGIESQGSLDEWKKIAAAYARPGMEGYQFVVAAGFGAPLMALTRSGSYPATFIHMTSQFGGQGKTTAQSMALSIYGKPEAQMLRTPAGKSGDTLLAVYNRVGVMNNLPVALDETSNAPPEVVSALAYDLSAGRPRIRATRTGSEQSSEGKWRTLVLGSGNTPLISRLVALKPGSNAEVLRIFEYEVRNPGFMAKEEAERLFPLLNEHYGVAGVEYLPYIVQNRDAVIRLLDETAMGIDRRLGMRNEERFWSAGIAATLVGNLLASKLGLTNYDPAGLLDFAEQVVYQMRATMNTMISTPMGSLHAFLNDMTTNILVVSPSIHGGEGLIRNPHTVRAPLVGRLELGDNKLFINLRALQKYAVERQLDLRTIERSLQEKNALKNKDMKKSLGIGSEFQTVPERCWEIDYSCLDHSEKPVALVESKFNAA